MTIKVRDLIKQIESDGWYLSERWVVTASISIQQSPGRVTIAGKPGQDVPEGTRKSILRQAGLE